MAKRNQTSERSAKKPAVVSLFSGAGGLDLGLEAAGYAIRLCVENDADARETLRKNRPGWKLAEPGDIHRADPETFTSQAGLARGEVALLAGGPPCQPFSKSAYWSNGGSRGLKDPRSKTLHAFLDFVEVALPQVLLLENVKALASNGTDEALRLFQNELRRINRRHKTSYSLQAIILNAADYGVPQIRERVFLLASIDGQTISLPPATHGDANGLERFRTCWDAIGDLDVADWPEELNPTGKWAGLLRSIPEGQNYLWHTPRGPGEPLFGWRTRYWSFLLKLAKDQPSWTIQADPGPATGPFHWTSRLLSIEEMARLQTFPSGYRIEGGRRSGHRQVGNAVPCALGELLGLEIRRQLFRERVRHCLHLIPAQRNDCPARERRGKVPESYLAFRAKHKDHPGTGKGPAARARERAQRTA